MTENDAYHPQDRAKIEEAEARLRIIKGKAAELERVLVAAKMVATPSVRNRYAYHRVVDGHDPLTAAFMACWGRLLFRV